MRKMCEVSELDMHLVWRETNSRLDTLARSVAECKNLEGALDFCRWLQGSGLIRIFKTHAHELHWPQSRHFRVDGSLIDSKVSDLMREIQDRYRTGNIQPRVDMAELERISYKLDLIAGQLSYLPVPQVDISAPPLRVIQGGSNE